MQSGFRQYRGCPRGRTPYVFTTGKTRQTYPVQYPILYSLQPLPVRSKRCFLHFQQTIFHPHF